MTEDTEQTAAIRKALPNLHPRWLKWLNEFVAKKRVENGGFFDLMSLWRGHDQPWITRETTEYKSPHMLNE